jgi:hypothetical protein
MALPLIAAGVGGLFSAIGARSASRTQANAATQAANTQAAATRDTNDMLKGFRQEDIARFQPFMQSGLQAQNALAYNMGLGPRPDGYAGFQASPGFQFAMDQGREAVQGSVAARQGLNSGAAMAELQRMGMGLGNQEFGNYMNRLQGMAAGGQNAAGMQGQASMGYGGQIGGNMMQGGQNAAQGIANVGNARAAGTVGAANAFNNALTQGVGMWQQNRMMNAFAPQPQGGAPMSSPRPMMNPFRMGA